jgi:hypothetical protein
MLNSGRFESKLKTKRTYVFVVVCLLAAMAAVPMASAQGTSEFTLTASSFNPDAIAPSGTSSSIIQVGSVNGFSGQVALSCQATSPDVTADGPTCTVSPSSVTPPASATATITTLSTTPTVGYDVTITGTGPTTTFTTPSSPLTVLAVTPQFTITIQSTVSPSSVPAGSGAQGVISVNPINGYISPQGTDKGVVLSCASMTPLVTITPVCVFSYPPGDTSLPVNGGSATSTLTISTFGPVTTGANQKSRTFYGFWISLPMLGLAGFGAAASGKKSRKAWALLVIVMVSGTLLLVPACGNNNSTSTTTPNGVTPANSYTFTIVGVDSLGVVSSNTSSTTSSGPTVGLTVTAPPAH